MINGERLGVGYIGSTRCRVADMADRQVPLKFL